MGINLGKLLSEAGVKGAKSTSTPLTLAEAKAMSRTHQPETEVFSKEARARLGPSFDKLKDPNKIHRVNDFIDELQHIAARIHDNHLDGIEIKVHALIGICQLAHEHRDRVGPSRKKGFNRIIPLLLQLRDDVANDPSQNIGELMFTRLIERH